MVKQDSGRLDGRVVLMLGAGSSAPGVSIGKACSIAMAREGARVATVDQHIALAQETADDIKREGGTAHAWSGDVSSNQDMQRVIEAVCHEFGRIDVVQVNAGIGKIGGPSDISLEQWRQIEAVNVDSLLIISQLVCPLMVKQGSGCLIGVSSVAGMRYLGYPHLAYGVTKAAVMHFMRLIAQQYASQGIRANTIVPGLIDTPRVQANVAKAFDADGDLQKARQARDSQVPMGRMGTPWEVASVATFLASDDAAYVTGTEIVVDGGLTGKFV